jgi:hypothetical protein
VDWKRWFGFHAERLDGFAAEDEVALFEALRSLDASLTSQASVLGTTVAALAAALGAAAVSGRASLIFYILGFLFLGMSALLVIVVLCTFIQPLQWRVAPDRIVDLAEKTTGRVTSRTYWIRLASLALLPGTVFVVLAASQALTFKSNTTNVDCGIAAPQVAAAAKLRPKNGLLFLQCSIPSSK